MHLISLALALAGFASSALAATPYPWRGTNWHFKDGQDPYSVTLRSDAHDDIPTFKALCSGLISDKNEEECTVEYDGPASGEGSLRIWTNVDVKASGANGEKRRPRLAVTLFYDNGITCGETYKGTHVGPLFGQHTHETLFTIDAKVDTSC